VARDGSAFGGDGSEGYGFAWSPADQVSDAADATPTTSIPDTYMLTVTDLHTGCTATDTVRVTPDPNAPSANAGGDRAITCLVSTAPISGSATGGDASAGYAYQWLPASDVANPNAATTTTTIPGVYTLRL